MSELFAISLDSFTTDVSALSYEPEAGSARLSLAASAPSAEDIAVSAPSIEDTVTLSEEAIASSASSNLLAFPKASEENLAAQAQAQATFGDQYPLQQKLNEGYSLAEVAAYFDLPLQSLDANAVVHTLNTAA